MEMEAPNTGMNDACRLTNDKAVATWKNGGRSKVKGWIWLDNLMILRTIRNREQKAVMKLQKGSEREQQLSYMKSKPRLVVMSLKDIEFLCEIGYRGGLKMYFDV
ncbi:OLC1v1031156C1 [Oldenlandia corymbosa var. corymbosa]|uniref:OLC1v1031156C1 n=1 Tax=Oldenlandia corymbosa var. corymbosa TaxID=529605 RepID=A0AAV1CJN4_OLDCO|nr:OLC1v1031156C1 [Oldenlandia corymbosa var. corymbosa]